MRAAPVSLTLCQPLVPQNQQVTTPVDPGLTTGRIPQASGSAVISNSAAAIDSLGNLTTLGSFTGMGTITGSSVSTISSSGSLPSSNGQGLVSILIANDPSNPPPNGYPACWNFATAQAAKCSSSSLRRVIGIVFNNAVSIGAVNYSEIVRLGTTSCVFDSLSPTPTAGHYVILSPTSSKCWDTTSSSWPSAQTPIGIVASTPTGPYVFVTNGDAPPSAALGTSNTWTAGVQNFQAATSLIVPGGAAGTPAVGTIAYDGPGARYSLQQGSATVVPVTSPLNLVPALPPETPDILCAAGCPNVSTDGMAPVAFQSYLALPDGFFASAGRSVRITYQLLANVATTGSIPVFSLRWTSSSDTSPVVLYRASDASALAVVAANRQFSITCVVTAGAAAGSSVPLHSSCSSSLLSGSWLLTANQEVPHSVDTSATATNERISLALYYAAGGTGDNVTLIGVIPEFLQ